MRWLTQIINEYIKGGTKEDDHGQMDKKQIRINQCHSRKNRPDAKGIIPYLVLPVIRRTE